MLDVDTHHMVDADGVPSLHDGQEGNEGGDHPASANHQGHAHGCHFVAVHQRLATDSVVPAHTLNIVTLFSKMTRMSQSVRIQYKMAHVVFPVYATSLLLGRVHTLRHIDFTIALYEI